MLSHKLAVTAAPHSKQLPSVAKHVCITHSRCCCWKQSSRQCGRQGVIARAQQDNSENESQLHRQSGDQVQQPALPTLWDGINWYCYTTLGLLFLTDFTPVGQWLVAVPTGAAVRLALLQWLLFVLPTVAWVSSRGWSLRDTFNIRPAAPRYYLLCLAAGPALWFMINLAIAIKTGNTHIFMTASTSAADVSAASTNGGSSNAGLALLNGGGSAIMANSGRPQQVVLLLLTAAASPAVAEELLFRGLLLTALRERLGSIDAVAVTGALFAIIHLDPQQFFVYCVLGFACGTAVLASGSAGPAMALHFAFNAAAVAAGMLLQ